MMTSSGSGWTTSPGSTRPRPDARARIFCVAVKPPARRPVAALVVMLRLLLLLKGFQGMHRHSFGMFVVKQNGRGSRVRVVGFDSMEKRQQFDDALGRSAFDRQGRRPKKTQS